MLLLAECADGVNTFFLSFFRKLSLAFYGAMLYKFGKEDLNMILTQLKKLRENVEMTQDELGRKVGRTARTISTYEKGGRTRIHDAKRIARALRCTVDDLTSKPEELVTTGEG
jgi:DNA-binding XRE family transcriptional regulator